MERLLIVNHKKDWPWHLPNVEVVDAKTYLTDSSYIDRKRVRIYNLCSSYGYQSLGYYVSLLANARGHRPRPSIMALLDLKSRSYLRLWSDEFHDQIQRSLKEIHSSEFVLSIYFGKNLAKKYDKISRKIFDAFEAPMIRAEFSKKDDWQLKRVKTLSSSEVPENHWEFLVESAREYFSAKHVKAAKTDFSSRYDLAILINPEEENPPSDEAALKKFERVAEKMGFSVEFITKDDFSRLAQFDALFIRETTQVNHHTYRFARRAAAEGLIVIDDPASILKCTNKVYLAELLYHHDIPTPKTWMVHRDNIGAMASQIELPAILKRPDGSFSVGVSKATTKAEFIQLSQSFLEDSDLILVQEFVQTDYDWRIGILNQKILYACRYHMAKNHWQIIENQEGKKKYGKVEAIDPESVPDFVLKTALRATKVMGNGLYGVDLKQKDSRCYVIEINDNPTIESGYEDKFSKDQVYISILQTFVDRIEQERKRRSL